MMRARNWLVAAAILTTSFLGVPAFAAPLVPVEVQLALFVNIWKLDHNFARPGGVTVGIIYQEELRESVLVKEELVAAAERLAIRTEPMPVDSEELMVRRLAETHADVIYVAPLRAIDIGAIARITRQRGLRTVTGVPEYVDSGLAVGIGLRKSRPLIIINLVAARAEGAAFSSQLLNLARIVGPL